MTLFDSFYKVSHRGLSSTVRKCVSRDSGLEYAVKIISKTQDEAINESIVAEVEVLTFLPKHTNISKDEFNLVID